jgi:dipeptidyl aminopeptidase/acylaminoacyl peptidase
MNLLKIGFFCFILYIPFQAADAQVKNIKSSDLYRMRFVRDVAISPDGSAIAYTVALNPTTGRTKNQLWIVESSSGKSLRLTAENDSGSNPVWSPDGKWIAFDGEVNKKQGLYIVKPDGNDSRFLAETKSTNSPLTYEGQSIEWSPDSKKIAFVSTTPGPETELATGDPVVITRYLYKPDYAEGETRFNDNRRRHIFMVDIGSGKVEQKTSGNFEEHSIDWSPDGKEILFVSNRESDPDLFYNPDLFALNVFDGSIRRLVASEGAEFLPRWSPDGSLIAFIGTRRGLTDLETDMEDTHVWIMRADGSDKKEIGKMIDNRQDLPTWAADGQFVYCKVAERGSAKLYRIPIAGGNPEAVINESGQLDNFSISKNNNIAYSFISKSDLAELFLKNGNETSKQLSNLNTEVLNGLRLADTESFTFVSNDFKYEIEAFLTKPVEFDPNKKYPMIVSIHGGPHGYRGPTFNLKAQCYAAHGWATLFVNFRGSTSYGQAISDAVFADQNGNEAQDVLYGTMAAIRRYPWIDRDRIGVEGWSYGGQLTAWLVTQTHIFKAAIAGAPIINNISYNYTTYYNMYEQMEWGVLPHQGNMMDVLWQRSALKYVAQVKTPTMLLHGENDVDVPTSESEQFYIALKDVGVETVMVRYPREGHAIREPKHQIDIIDRSMRWFDQHFTK